MEEILLFSEALKGLLWILQVFVSGRIGYAMDFNVDHSKMDARKAQARGYACGLVRSVARRESQSEWHGIDPPVVQDLSV